MLMPKIGFGRLRKWAQAHVQPQNGNAVYESFGRVLMAYAGGAWDGKPCVYSADLTEADYHDLMPQFVSLANENGLKLAHRAIPDPAGKIIHVTFNVTNDVELARERVAALLKEAEDEYMLPSSLGNMYQYFDRAKYGQAATEIEKFVKQILFYRSYMSKLDWAPDKYISTNVKYTDIPGLMQDAQSWLDRLNKLVTTKNNLVGRDPDEVVNRLDKTTGKPEFIDPEQKEKIKQVIIEENKKLLERYAPICLVPVTLDPDAETLSAKVERNDSERSTGYYFQVVGAQYSNISHNEDLVDQTVQQLLAIDSGDAKKAFQRAQKIFKSHIQQRNNNVAVNWNMVVLKLYQLATDTPTFDEQNKVKASHAKAACGFCQRTPKFNQHFCSPACQKRFFAGQVDL